MMLYTSLFACATVFSAVTAQVVNLNLPNQIIVGAQVGDETCPTGGPNDVNANVFAVVNLVETVDLDVTPLASTLVTINAGNQINIGASVCLCLDAGINTPLTAAQTANLNVAALAAVDGLIVDAAAAAGSENLVDGLLGNGGITPVASGLLEASRDLCDCAANQIPGCTDGACTCTDCPTGQFYNPTTGACALAPSGLARSKRMEASRAGRNFF